MIGREAANTNFGFSFDPTGTRTHNLRTLREHTNHYTYDGVSFLYMGTSIISE
jgi:hypothetical protein